MPDLSAAPARIVRPFLTRPLRPFSSYLAVGALGTIPGFIAANALFWVAVLAIAVILRVPFERSSDIFKGIEAIGFAVFFGIGISIVNIFGCALGFGVGIWIRHKLKARKSNKPVQPNAGP